MKCSTHEEIDAQGACVYCGKMFCKECLVEVEGKYYCKSDIGKVLNETKAAANDKKDSPMVFMNAGGGGAATSSSSSSSSSNSGGQKKSIHWGMFMILLICTGGLGLIIFPLWYK